MAGWQIKKEITAGNILAMVAIVIPAFLWAATVEVRLTKAEAADAIAGQRIDEVQEQTVKRLDELIVWIRRISDRMDRFQDK